MTNRTQPLSINCVIELAKNYLPEKCNISIQYDSLRQKYLLMVIVQDKQTEPYTAIINSAKSYSEYIDCFENIESLTGKIIKIKEEIKGE